MEDFLQDDETIELQDNCDYCTSDGAMALVNSGVALLTNKRLIVAKRSMKTTMLTTLVVVVPVALVLGFTSPLRLGYIEAALIGALVGGVFGLIVAVLTKGKGKISEDADIDFDRENISSVTDGSRGIRKMLVIRTGNGEICKISTKDKDKWRAALLRQA